MKLNTLTNLVKMKSFACLYFFLLLSFAHSRISHESSYQSIGYPGGDIKDLPSSKQERASDWTIWKEGKHYHCLYEERAYRWNDGCTWQRCTCLTVEDEDESCKPEDPKCSSDFFSSLEAVEGIARKKCCRTF